MTFKKQHLIILLINNIYSTKDTPQIQSHSTRDNFAILKDLLKEDNTYPDTANYITNMCYDDNRSIASAIDDNRSVASTVMFTDENSYGFDLNLIININTQLRNIQSNRQQFLLELLKLISQTPYNYIFMQNLLNTPHFQEIIKRILELNTKSEEEQNNREKLNKTVEELSKKLETLDTKLNQEKQETTLEEFKKRLESLENIVQSKKEADSTITEHTKEIAGLSALIKQLQETVAKQSESITILKANNQNLETQINEERKKREVVEASLSQIISELSSEDFKNLSGIYKERITLITERLNRIEKRANDFLNNNNKKDGCSVM